MAISAAPIPAVTLTKGRLDPPAVWAAQLVTVRTADVGKRATAFLDEHRLNRELPFDAVACNRHQRLCVCRRRHIFKH